MKNFDITTLLSISELSTYLSRVEKLLASVVVIDNQYLSTPLDRIINAKSKRLRPTLLIAAAKGLGKEVDDSVIRACVALELIHIGSLVHDDIMDEASHRWGVQTINVKEGINQAIVVGDYLLAKASEVAASINVEASKIIAQSIISLCDGQSLELAELYNTKRSLASYNKAIYGKTATLISAAVELGGITAGLASTELDGLRKYGQEFGLAFQLIDDTIDFLSEPKISGKPAGADIKAGVYTLPVILSLSGDHGPDLTMMLEKKSSDLNPVIKILNTDRSFDKTIALAQQSNKTAAMALDGYGHNNVIAALQKFPEAYLKWALTNLISPKYIDSLNFS